MSTANPVAPCDFVVFGGTGDLALRKLLPALYLRDRDGQLPAGTRIIAGALIAISGDGIFAFGGREFTSCCSSDILRREARESPAVLPRRALEGEREIETRG